MIQCLVVDMNISHGQVIGCHIRHTDSISGIGIGKKIILALIGKIVIMKGSIVDTTDHKKSLDDASTDDMIQMMYHCPEHNCDGCPGLRNHCTGRIDMMYAVARHMELRMAQIKGMTTRMYDAEEERNRLRDENLMRDRGRMNQDAVATELGISLETVAEDNIENLRSRKERGTLHGDGDDR